MATPIWPQEGVAINSTGEMVVGSLADIANDSATALTAIQAVTDVLPDAGALTTINAATIAIQAVTDALPDAGALTSISGETDKIDGAAATGLLGTHNSLAYRVNELERHFHGRSRRWGATGAPDETNAIDANVNRPFVAVSGANAWGAAIPVVGTDDVPTPTDAAAYFDLDHMLITEVDDATVYRIRIIFGSGTSGDAITAEQWTEFIFFAGTGPKSTPVALPVLMKRVAVGEKCWVQVWNATNLSEVDFYFGCHGYPG